MPLPTPQRNEPISQNDWQLGMITSIPQEEIPLGGAQFINNLEFDLQSNLITRNGVSLFVDSGETTRITSIFRAQYSDGTVWILFTTGTKLFRCTESGGSKTDITGALTFPSNTRWQWVMFGDFAIGVNGATSGTNPVKVNAAGTASLLANAPFGKYIEVWNNRIWIARADAGNRNRIDASAINLPEDWTVDDDAGAINLNIDPNDGDFITGLKEFKASLYVHKRKKINVVNPIGTPATIPGNLRVDIYTTNVGTLSGYSIQNVIDDQLFLSEAGVMSLVLAPLGELKGSVISRNIGELSNLKKTLTPIGEVIAYVFDDVNQYIISIPSSLSLSGLNEAWVLDYQKIGERDEKGFPIVRWVRMDGKIAGTAYAERLDLDYKAYLIADNVIASTNTDLHQYQPTNPVKTFNDVGAAYTQILRTKSYKPNSPLLRSLWHRFGAAIRLISDNLTMIVSYFYNNHTVKDGSYEFLFETDTSSLTLWGGTTWNGGLWNDGSTLDRDEKVWRQFRKNAKGRKAEVVALEFKCDQADQGFIFKFVQLECLPLNQRRVRTK